MARQHLPGGQDNWGRRPKDPFFRKLYEDPDMAGRISRMFTIGMILFWLFFVAGMFFFVYFLIFGS